jgi:hypothetical protein
MWEVFHDNIEMLSAEIPWMVTMGNHERDWPGTNSTKFGGMDSMGECGVPTMRRFAAHPFVSSSLPPSDQPWYSIEVGVITIIVMSTEHDMALGSAQHAWLLKKFQSIDRQATPWLVVAGHRPYVVDSDWSGDQDFATYFQDSIGNLLNNYQVDVLLGGHHHSYQRSCPMNGRTCGAKGLVVVNAGMAGAGLNSVSSTKPSIFRHVDDKHFGYLRIVADNATLQAEFVHSESRKVYDQITLKKDVHLEVFT